jgi:hypothetical protein
MRGVGLTNYFWTGATDTDSTNATNWNPNAVPGAGDVVIFDNQATQDCFWQHTATGASITVDEMILEDSFQYLLRLQAVPTIKGMFLNKNIRDGSANSISFANGPISSGGYKTYNNKYLLIGDSAVYTNGRQNLTFDFGATAVCAFDDGQHPKIHLKSGNFTPKYTTPTGTSGKTDLYQLEIDAGCTLTPDVSIVADDKNKKFKFASQTTTQFVCNIATVNWGASTVEFTGVTSSTFNLPVSSTTNYNSGDFFAQYRKVILTADTAGYRIDMQDNTFLSVEEFEIGDGLLFVGPRALNAQGSDIRTILPPKIRGSWSFSSISDGIYRSPRQASGPMPKVQGNFHITGKLDVDGLIDPTGLELNPQGSNPGGVAANTLWLNSGDSNKLYHGSSEVGGGGGGGSGTVTSVAVSGSDGIEVDSGSPITTSGTIALGVNKTNMLSHLNVTDGATPTNTANVTAAGALMDSEVTNLAQVKAFDSADYATAAQGTTADSATQPGDNVSTLANDAGYTTAAGTVTDVTGTSPIASSGGATPAISISAATTGTAGSMSGADKSKLDGISAGADVALPVANNNTTLINTNTANISAISTKAKMSVYLSSNAPYTSGATKIPHDLIMWDSGGDFDPITNCFIAPRDGHYLVTCSYYSTVAPSWSFSLIYVDDGTGFAIRLRRESSNDRDNMISGIIQLGTGHKVAHYAYRSSSSGDIGATLNTLTYFQVTELV